MGFMQEGENESDEVMYEMFGRGLNPFVIIFSVLMDTLSTDSNFLDSTEFLPHSLGDARGNDNVVHATVVDVGTRPIFALASVKN